ncbi:MAG TPA: FG-GAP-like repeat-containing protein [Smithellaceae bacterium]|nr:FG-GAP-like repeat-containing protein [Smithellaceae bacterium]HRS89958.1 FG-GAP-like repeat-containing protein [Smithellaceae bacterium]HRV25852.1 FG-GAP-like repeat-containing protein [Smithellaceae bacterium]
MKKYMKLAFCLGAILLLTGSLWAKDKYTVTVLPFSTHSADNIDYLKDGITNMLSSRIAVPGKIDVTAGNLALAEMRKVKAKDLTLADVHAIGKNLKSDYVVWGSITKIGNSISIDGKLADISANKSDVNIFTQSQNIDDVLPRINDFSQKIVSHILGTTPSAAMATSPAPSSPDEKTVSRPLPPGTSREAQIIAGMRTNKRGTMTSAINTEYINSPEPVNRRGFWMSQQIPTEFKGMDIGDVNNDGANEIVVIDRHNIYIYQKKDTEMQLLEKISGKAHLNYIAVDVADINRNGVPEIIVTSINNKTLDSFVIEYKDGKYQVIASGIRWFLRVIDTPSGVPLLLGQDFGMDKPFDTQIYEIIWKNGKYVPDQKMKIPVGLSIYGLTLADLGTGGGEKVIALDELDYLCILEKNNKHITRVFTLGFSANEDIVWRSDTHYGGSNNLITNFDRTKPQDEYEKMFYANLRILTFDTNNDGKKEIIIVKNLSSTGRLFKNLNLFTASEIYNLEWDGLGMIENWRTKKINGYVADYAFKDVDNDGKPEIVLALVLSTGASLKNRSVIVVYELETAE